MQVKSGKPRCIRGFFIPGKYTINHFIMDNNKNPEAQKTQIWLNDKDTLQTPDEVKKDKTTSVTGKQEKVTATEWSEEPTLGDKIEVSSENEDILTPVTQNTGTGRKDNESD